MINFEKLLYLTMDDVKSIGFSDHDFINCVSDIFVQYGQGTAFPLSEMGTNISPKENIRVTSGWVKKSRTSGVRWTSTFKNRQGAGLNPNAGVIILNDSTYGLPKVIMDAFYISSKCTAATFAVFARFYARKDTEVLSLLGANQQGQYNLNAMRKVLERLSQIRVYDSDVVLANKLARSIEDDFPCEVIVCDTVKEVLKGADVVVDAESSQYKKLAQIPNRYLPTSGVFIASTDVTRFGTATTSRMDKIVVDGLQQSDSLSKISIYANLGEVCVGRKNGRETEKENILAINRGLVVQEIYIGSKMYDTAREMGIGLELEPITW
jgi:ornithine cyclodeaminase/alanine dehydrogenase-like protein (mu-crystallin family)